MNAVLCAAKHYQLNYPMLTLHKSFSYIIDGEKLSSHSVTLFPINELALAIGMEIDRKNDCINNWKEQYRTHFEKGELIIALLNDYYNPLRVDTYQREHLPHHILIYSMDDVSENLSVVESRYRTTVLYKNMEMSYDDFEKSHFQTETMYRYICRKIKSTMKESYKNVYLHSSIHATEQSVDNLNNYICFLSTNEISDVKNWIKCLDDICVQLKVEQYVFEKVFCNNDLADLVADIYQTWYLLRAKAVRLTMIGQSENMASKLVSYLDKIMKLENDKFNMLCSYTIKRKNLGE